MAGLVDLVQYRDSIRNELSALSLDKEIQDRTVLVDKIKLNNPNMNVPVDYTAIQQASQQIVDTLNQEIIRIERAIDDNIKAGNQTRETVSIRINEGRFIPLDEDTESIVVHRINHYCHWKYPALQLHWQRKKWSDAMVAAEPLYLLCSDKNIKQQQIQGYTIEFQNRLRFYNIEDITDIHMQSQAKGSGLPIEVLLPAGQFGFVLCWETIDYMRLDKITNYLRKVLLLLRPGGTFMFSYSNCDLFESARSAELNSVGYCSSRILKTLCEEVGYIVTKFENYKIDNDSWVSWIEIRKPGELVSIKSHPVIGEIVEK
jgi:hypothetical protein